MSDTFTFKKSHLLVFLAIVVIGVFGSISVFAQEKTTTNSAVSGNVVKSAGANNGDYQTVKLSFKNYRYELSPSTLKKDVPVRLEVDLDTVGGCMRDVVISSFGVRKYVRSGDNIIEFTPDKSGTFNIACSMNMGRGTFSVADNSGEVSNYKEAPIEAGSCGSDGDEDGSGGCGCGGF